MPMQWFSMSLKVCWCALLVPLKGEGEIERTGGEFCDCKHSQKSGLDFHEVPSSRSVKKHAQCG